MEGKTAWEAASETAAKTASERYLARLARKAFLSLWSYPNVYTDEGRAKGKGDGKELCDLLVVFGNHVLIFSDKACAFPDHPDIKVAWGRWYKSAVHKSVGFYPVSTDGLKRAENFRSCWATLRRIRGL